MSPRVQLLRIKPRRRIKLPQFIIYRGEIPNRLPGGELAFGGDTSTKCAFDPQDKSKPDEEPRSGADSQRSKFPACRMGLTDQIRLGGPIFPGEFPATSREIPREMLMSSQDFPDDQPNFPDVISRCISLGIRLVSRGFHRRILASM